MTTATTNQDISKRFYQDYDSLTEAQRAKGTREEHDARRESLGLTGINAKVDTKPRMAGEALRILKRSETPNQTGINTAKEAVYGGGLAGFDAGAAGAGSQRGNDRLSKRDIRGLRQQGVSKQEILDYVEANPDVNSSGAKAQKLLNKFKTSLTENGETPNGETPDTDTETPGTPGTPGDPTEPETSPDNPPSPDQPEGDTPTMNEEGNEYYKAPGYQYGDYKSPVKIKDTEELIADSNMWRDNDREGMQWHKEFRTNLFDGLKQKYGQDSNAIFRDTMTWMDGKVQEAEDKALIQETKFFGDMDAYTPNFNFERYIPEEIDTDVLGDIADDYEDKLDDM